MIRAWVMLTFEKNSDYYSSHITVMGTVTEGGGAAFNGATYKHQMSLYGHYDMLIVVEGSDIPMVHRAISDMQKGVKTIIGSTSSFIAADPTAWKQDKPGAYVCIGINTKLGQEKTVRDKLYAESQVVLADMVFGEFDVLVLLKHETGVRYSFRDIISQIPEITRTTTMLPHHVYVGESPKSPPTTAKA